MIGEVYQWNAARKCGRVRPVGDPDHPGLHVHRSQFGSTRPEIGLRVVYEPWRSGGGAMYATNLTPVTAEQAEVRRCLG